MHLHLATGMQIKGHIEWIYHRVRSEIAKPLLTFAYRETESTIPVHVTSQPGKVRLLVDSGAFTAYTQGRALRPEDYAEWAHALARKWAQHLRALHFFSLDVIGDQAASWRNHTRLEQLGLQAIPIVTYGAARRDLERALEYSYLALGGLVPWAKRRAELAAWLDWCFALIVARYRRTGYMPKVHILGISQSWVLDRYPCYSADSSTSGSFSQGRASRGSSPCPRRSRMGVSSSCIVMTSRAFYSALPPMPRWSGVRPRAGRSEESVLKTEPAALGRPTLEQAAAAVRLLLEFIGEDPDREGLRDTPERAARGLQELTRGLREPAPRMALFQLGEVAPHQPVLVRGIRFASLCEHHLLPFWGTADVAYLPVSGHVLGLSKLARLVQHVAQRPQVQERLAHEIAAELGTAAAGALRPELRGPLHAFVRLRAQHGCMAFRGVCSEASTVYTAALGDFSTSATLREQIAAQLASH